MKKLLVALMVAAALSLTLAACGENGASGEGPSTPTGEGEASPSVRAAMIGGPGVDYYNPGQYKCPVTGKGIKADYYYDHSDGRIYFHSEEAKKKFVSNPDQYLGNIEKK